MSAVQGQTYFLIFPLRDANDPGAALHGATGWAGTDIQIAKPSGATAPTNLAAVAEIGTTGLYLLELSVADLALGLTDGQVGEIVVLVNKTGAVLEMPLSVPVAFNGPGTLTVSERATLIAAINAGITVPSAAANAAAVEASLLGDFAAIASAISALPSAAANAAAVGTRMLADGFTLEQSLLLCTAWAMGGGNFPMTPAGGAITVLSADGTKTRISLSIDADGVRTIVAVPDVT